MQIQIEHQPDEKKLHELGVFSWPIWEKEISQFPWTYSTPETCYILEGKAIITPEAGEAVEIHRGDLVTFPAGLRCTWQVTQPIRKHYNFG